MSEIRTADGRGRHTTTHRQLIMLDSGVMIIDTPGMRELGIWDAADGLEHSFADIERYFGKCKFRNCRHQSEPGCAIKQAIENGELSQERWNSYLQLKKESSYSEDKDDTKYDVVICSETIESIESTFQLGENFLKKGGTLLYQKVFSTVQDVPKELDEFDGGVYPLTKLNKIFNDLGYYITHFATGTENDWNRYYTWSVRRDIDKLRKKPNNQELKKQINSWNYMHFKYRMPYENKALFGLQKL